MCLAVILSCSQKTSEDKPNILSDLEKSFRKDVADVWYPRVVDDKFGGFLTNFSNEWEQLENQNKLIITQTRHVWTLSKLHEFYPEEEQFKEMAKHGVDYLINEMWDHEHGGFYMEVTQDGTPILENYNGGKWSYGNAFAIYGLAAYYKISGDSIALEYAVNTFNWLEENAHDDEYGGYFDRLKLDGTPESQVDSMKLTRINIPFGRKDYNSSIHLLEAFTELYSVFPDTLVYTRLEEMFHIVRDTMVDKRGYLKLLFDPNWHHVTHEIFTEEYEYKYSWDHVTAGHDVETAFLLIEAAHALGFEDMQPTLQIAKKMVDHSVTHVWDDSMGGLYDEALYSINEKTVEITNHHKNWWAQAEALNAFLLMHTIYPEEEYYSLFEKQWNYINANIIDHEFGEWYRSGIDKNPNVKNSLKGGPWKGPYHNARAMINCINMLKSQSHD